MVIWQNAKTVICRISHFTIQIINFGGAMLHMEDFVISYNIFIINNRFIIIKIPF